MIGVMTVVWVARVGLYLNGTLVHGGAVCKPWQRRLGISTQRRARTFVVYDAPRSGARQVLLNHGMFINTNFVFAGATLSERAKTTLVRIFGTRSLWIKPLKTK